MSDPILLIEPANPSDLNEIANVLRGAKLPAESIEEHLSGFLVARGATGIAGCVAVERYENVGILRSLAVTPDFRDKTLGVRLAQAVVDLARNDGLQTIVLLTETAEGFFEKKLGFSVVERSSVAASARESWQFTGAVCQSATCMRLELR